MSARVLVLYASTHGQTGKIADRVGAVVLEQGLAVRVRQLGHETPRPDLTEFDAVVVGASVHAGHHQREIVEWITEHQTTLSSRPSAFFSVSLTAADDTDEAVAATREQISEVLDATGWMPTTTATFAGALLFREYHLPTRVLMRLVARRIARHTGVPIDVHDDTEYTDWVAVDDFARHVATMVQRPHATSLHAAGGTVGS